MYVAHENTYSNAYRNVYVHGMCVIYDVMYNKVFMALQNRGGYKKYLQ